MGLEFVLTVGRYNVLHSLKTPRERPRHGLQKVDFCPIVGCNASRSKVAQYNNQSLIKIEGVNTAKDAEFYFGKRVAYIYKVGRAIIVLNTLMVL